MKPAHGLSIVKVAGVLLGVSAVKHLNQARKYGVRLAAVSLGALAPVLSFAGGGGTYDSLTGAVDFADVGTAVVAIAALIAVALVVKKGARMVLSMIGR